MDPYLPGGPAFPPPPHTMPGQPGYFAPRVRFDAIGEAWTLLQQQMGVWVGAMLIYFIVPAAIYFVGAMILFPIMAVGTSSNGPPSTGAAFAVVGGMLVLMLLVFTAVAVMLPGLYRMSIKQVRGEPIAINDLFSAADQALPALGAMLLTALATMAGAIICILPAYIVAGLLMLAMPIMADQRVGPVEALTRSWEALKHDMWMATLFHIVLGFVAGIGVLLCGVGMFVTMPLFFLALAIVYRDFFLFRSPFVEPPATGYPPAGPSDEPPPFHV